ncbi:hypothetical protein GOP47_0021102 [Adiantum capillus-veneris]|uniref:Uncharacterized protein n=1 Tax=Adiantum capillus-veneris TaxID=13818 RepID=A0A9D4Z8C5_ADICA|nr:hypothetical protein GOP47_0021102 [Adiantum capillus-veneris]
MDIQLEEEKGEGDTKGKEKVQEEPPQETVHPLEEELIRAEGERATKLMAEIVLEKRPVSSKPTLQPLTELETSEILKTDKKDREVPKELHVFEADLPRPLTEEHRDSHLERSNGGKILSR